MTNVTPRIVIVLITALTIVIMIVVVAATTREFRRIAGAAGMKLAT
jgi:hypothetical protein